MDKQTEKIEELAGKYRLSMLVAFGSLARGDATASSDADVAYASDRPLALMEEAAMAVELSALFKKEVDLVNIKTASPMLARNIFKDGVPAYERERGLFADYLARSMRIYEETMPLYKAKMELL